MDLGGPVVSALWKLNISGDFPPIMSLRTRSRRVHTGVEGSALLSLLPTIKEVNEEDVEESVSVYNAGAQCLYSGEERRAALF